MDDLRAEIRAAFQKEQAANPPDTYMRADVVRAAAVQPHRRANLQWMAVAAAVVIAALVVLSLMSTRVAQRGVPSHTRPSPTAVAGDYGPPPAGVPLFYLKDPDHAGWYVGFDWTGKPRATLKFTGDPTLSLSQSADGSYFIFRPGAKGGGGQFYDRQGKPLSGNGGFAGAQWADDNTRQCGMAVDESTGQWILATQVPGQPVQQVATVAPYNAGDQSALSVLACSLRNNRALVVRVTNSYLTDLWVIQPSDGKVVKHQSYSDGAQIASLVASGDGLLLATNSSKSEGYIAGPSAPTTTVVRFSDGATLMKTDPSIGVVAFSADDTMVLVTTSPWASGTPTHLALMEVRTGQILWRYDGTDELAGVFMDPAGSGFAVMLQNPSDQGPHAAVSVVVVAGDGAAQALHGGYQRP